MAIDKKYLDQFILATERSAYGASLLKGKGNKIINIPTKSFNEGKEYMMDICCLAEDSQLHIHHQGKTGGKSWTLKELEGYFSVRAKRGKVLPSGYNGQIKLQEIIKATEADLG